MQRISALFKLEPNHLLLINGIAFYLPVEYFVVCSHIFILRKSIGMRTRYHAHTAVFFGGLINSKPDGHDIIKAVKAAFPIGAVFVPWRWFARFGFLTDKTAAPQANVRPYQRLNHINHFISQKEIEKAAVLQVRGVHFIGSKVANSG